jgi:hypothetical protein
MSVTYEEANVYTEALQWGGPLVLVKTAETSMPKAKTIMSHPRPIDVGERLSPRI